MSREIKFRVYDRHTKVMAGPKGLSVTFEDGRIDRIWFKVSEYESWGSARYPLDQERYVVMQFTGLWDMDGREIYEGDVVDLYGYGADTDWTERTPQQRDVATMARFPLYWMVFESYEEGGEGLSDPTECKVIGNIYETEPCDQKGCEHDPMEHFLFDAGVAGLKVFNLSSDQRVHWATGYSVWEMNNPENSDAQEKTA